MASFGSSFYSIPQSSPDTMDWSPTVDVTVQWRRHQDEATGLINSPRLAPHRLGSKPLKSSLKISKFRSWKEVRFASAQVTQITSTSMITGDEVRPGQRGVGSKWTPEFHQDDQDQEPSEDDSSESLENPPSFLDDVAMSGIDFLGDMAAFQYERIETNLDCLLEIAESNSEKNKASSPISSSEDRHLHPCLRSNPPRTSQKRNPNKHRGSQNNTGRQQNSPPERSHPKRSHNQTHKVQKRNHNRHKKPQNAAR